MLNRDCLQQAQARMRDRGIDAYLILTHDDYIYFFGEDRFQPRAVIPAFGPPIVVTFQGEEAEVRESMGVDDVKIFGTVGQQIKDVVGTMRGMTGGKESMTVGVQMWFNTPAFLLNLFQRANPKIKVVDIAPVMDELRLVKDADEVRLMREAARIAAVGMKTAAAWLRPGISENEVGAEIEYAMRKAGGQGVATPVFVNSGIRSGWLHGTASDKQVEAGRSDGSRRGPTFSGLLRQPDTNFRRWLSIRQTARTVRRVPAGASGRRLGRQDQAQRTETSTRRPERSSSTPASVTSTSRASATASVWTSRKRRVPPSIPPTSVSSCATG